MNQKYNYHIFKQANKPCNVAGKDIMERKRVTEL